MIGDAILFYLSDNRLSLVGRPSALNWVEYNQSAGGYKVNVERDERSAVNRGSRKLFRFQVQGPHALKVIEKVTGKAGPDIRFFNMGAMTIGGQEVHALRHGMVGQPGWELFGPWAQAEAVRGAILEAGREYGIRQVGARTYPTSCLESGWIPSPLPAVYTGDKLRPRQWLTSKSYEAMASLGGSFYSEDIRDYYLTPFDLGYGPFVKFDHEFVGREALERMAVTAPRQKVTLVWNGDDVARVSGRSSATATSRNTIDLPLANYATLPCTVWRGTARPLGCPPTLATSTTNAPSSRSRFSTTLTPHQARRSRSSGESKDVGRRKPTVERHGQAEIRATVAPVPISEVAVASRIVRNRRQLLLHFAIQRYWRVHLTRLRVDVDACQY